LSVFVILWYVYLGGISFETAEWIWVNYFTGTKVCSWQCVSEFGLRLRYTMLCI